jgi:hypothetical protein
MRRIDIILLTVGLLLAAVVPYAGFQLLGLDEIQAGLWSQGIMVGGVMVWVSTYALRVFTQKMTYGQQLKDYEETMLQRSLDAMSPEEVERLMAEVEADRDAGRGAGQA